MPYPSITRSIRNLHKLGNNLCVSYNFRCSENNWNREEIITGNAYAPLFIYSQIKNRDDIQCSKGSHISDALLKLRNVGAVKKEQFDVMCADYVSDNIMSLASANKIGGFTTLVVYGQMLMDPVKVSVIKESNLSKATSSYCYAYISII